MPASKTQSILLWAFSSNPEQGQRPRRIVSFLAILYQNMLAPALLALLLVPAQADVVLRWAPAIDTCLPLVEGRGRDVVRGLDSAVAKGLTVRINEIHALSTVGVRNLKDLQALLRRPDVVAVAAKISVPPDHLTALRRSLEILAPVIRRLESQGVAIDKFARPSADLPPLLSRALAAEARKADRQAQAVVARYSDSRVSLDQALADSQEADALIADRYPYLSTAVLDRLIRAYEPARTQDLAFRRAHVASESVTMVTAEDQATMRDAVADRPARTDSGRTPAPNGKKDAWSLIRRTISIIRSALK